MSTAREIGERIKAWVSPFKRLPKATSWQEVCSDVDALVSLAQPGEGALTGWQSIETMPMRQTVLLAIDGKWVTTGDRWPNPVGIFWDSVDDDESDESTPTHWMPLPPPPGITSTPTGDSNG